MQYQLPFEREGKTILPFTYDNVSTSVSDLESKEEDLVESVMKLNMKFTTIQIQMKSLLSILGLNGHKRLLRKLGT